MPQLLDVAIGTIFVFLLFSLVVSALNEYILTLFDQRAKFLRLGLAKMFGEKIVTSWRGKYLSGGLTGGEHQSIGEKGQKLLDHGLINGFTRADKDDKTGKPSYNPAGAFVTGLLDILIKPVATAGWSVEHSKLIGEFLTKVNAAKATPDALYAPVLASYTAEYGRLVPVPVRGSAVEKLHTRVVDSSAKPQLKADLLAAADLVAAQVIIDRQSASLKAELQPLIAKAAGDWPAAKTSIDAWFTPATELAVLEGAAAAVFASTLNPAAQHTAANILAGIEALPDGSKLKETLQSIFRTVEGDVKNFKLGVEGWFNGVMDRVSGWYKRFAQKWMIFIGFALAASFNVDTLEIVRVLSNNPNLAKAVANGAAVYMSKNKENAPLTPDQLEAKREQALKSVADKSEAVKKAKEALATAQADLKTASEKSAASGPETTAKEADVAAKKKALVEAQERMKSSEDQLAKAIADADGLAKFKAAVAKLRETGIPLGWTPEVAEKLGFGKGSDSKQCWSKRMEWRVLISMIGGWLLTGIAASLGAPFWFDLLGRFVNVRASGKPPGEKEATSTPTRPPPANIDTTPGTHAPLK